MKPSHVRLGKFLALVLRHRPEVIGVTLDENGWVSIEELVRCARPTHRLSPESIREVAETDEKGRYEISPDGKRIRARYGHSRPVDLQLEPVAPPEMLCHGTADQRLSAILSQGLRAHGRQYVHLSEDEQTAIEVGRRHGTPVVLRILSGQMHRTGHRFFRAQAGTWLTESVPPAFIEISETRPGTTNRGRGERRLQSCGVLCWRESPTRSFLLMERDRGGLDLPKGHMRPGESELECALRELREETGIAREQVEIEPGFRFVTSYRPHYRRFGGERVEKTVVIFLGRLTQDVNIVPTEHRACAWIEWNPPHELGNPTIDELLREVERFLESGSGG